jgi:hypothetical protein
MAPRYNAPVVEYQRRRKFIKTMIINNTARLRFYARVRKLPFL